ncbi:MAG: hypothetical protein NC218_02435 [Acetobacter sp.]|nr:hypothetical protein [Acetobacter sp.]
MNYSNEQINSLIFASKESYFHDADAFTEELEGVNLKEYFTEKLKNDFQSVSISSEPVAKMDIVLTGFNKTTLSTIGNIINDIVQDFQLDDDFVVDVRAKGSQLFNGVARQLLARADNVPDEPTNSQSNSLMTAEQVLQTAINSMSSKLTPNNHRLTTITPKKFTLRVGSQYSNSMSQDNFMDIVEQFSDIVGDICRNIEFDKEFEVVITFTERSLLVYFLYYDGDFFYLTKRNAKLTNRLTGKTSAYQQMGVIREKLRQPIFDVGLSKFSDISFTATFRRMLEEACNTAQVPFNFTSSTQLIEIIAYGKDLALQHIRQVAKLAKELVDDGELLQTTPICIITDSTRDDAISRDEEPNYLAVILPGTEVIIHDLEKSEIVLNGYNTYALSDIIKYDLPEGSQVQVTDAYSLDKSKMLNTAFSLYMTNRKFMSRYEDCLMVAVLEPESTTPNALQQFIQRIRKALKSILSKLDVATMPRFYAITMAPKGAPALDKIIDFGPTFGNIY